MKITNIFFDKNEWSIYATIQTLIIIIIMKIGIKNINLRFLVLSSLIAMIKGELLPKLIYVFFLCLLTWSNDKSFFQNTFYTILAALIVNYIPYNNKIHKLFSKNTYLRLLLFSSIFLWFIYILFLLYRNIN